jgi:hypothetical protein
MESAALPQRQPKNTSHSASHEEARAESGIVKEKSRLKKGRVISNHILDSFHLAFISPVPSVPDYAASWEAVRGFIFAGHAHRS